jgi:two-component system response regulator FixJ
VVVDDDPAVRDSTAVILEQAGHKVYAFESGAALVNAGVPCDTDVILLDLLMPGLSGLDTLRLLQAHPDLPPVIVLTGHGDVPSAVDAMKLGAAEFLEKPYPMRQLLELVATVERSPDGTADESGQRRDALEKVARLTMRQREILKGIALGEASKNTAHRLGLSVRTVEAYRGHVFERLGVRGMADAVRIAVLAGLVDA